VQPVPIPDFDDDGNLSEGLHEAGTEDVRDALVTPFTESRTRHAIFEWWCDLREALGESGVLRAHWLAGSFVTDKPDPADLDLITLLDGPGFDGLPRHRRLLVRSLVAGHATEELWRCDNYPVLEYPADDPAHAPTVAATDMWRYHFGHDRDGQPRGFVVVTA
jgi:hypothetical protein